MKTFEIEIQEILTKTVKVKANSSIEATDLVYEDYKKEKYVLDDSNLSELNFIDINEESELNKIKRLANEVISYLWKDEKKHYQESEEPENHIFKTLKALKESL